MAAPETEALVPALGAHARAEIGELLQKTLVDLIALSLTGRQLHWNVVGPGFRTLHVSLDELVDDWHELADTVAERAVAVGFSPDGQAPSVIDQSELEPVPPGPVQTAVAIFELAARVAAVDERTRERMERLGNIDLASQGVLIAVVCALEKQLWMLRSEL